MSTYMYKALKIQLEPNNRQREMFAQHAGVTRHAYNQGLQYCNDLFKKGIKTPSSIDLHKWLVATVKKENEWYYDSSKFAPQQALRNLETAFKKFHALQKASKYNLRHEKTVKGVVIKGELKGLPNFKKKGQNDSFYLEGDIRFNKNKIKLPKIGWVKLAEDVDLDSVKNCVISRRGDKWFVAFKFEFEPIVTVKKEDVVGVDLGIKTLATLSNGKKFDNLKPYNKAKKKLRRQQKELSRRYVKGAENQSANYKKSATKLANTHRKVADARKDSLHKLTTYLAKNYETVVIEDLKIKNMVKNHKLASAILDGGFYEFKRQLLYKKEMYGGEVIIADTFYASTKLCSCCGYKKEKMSLSERTYECSECKLIIDRDLNASLNLMKLAVSSTVSAFGDRSSTVKAVQPVDELGIKPQIYSLCESRFSV